MSLIPGEPPLVHAPLRGDPRLVPWLTRSDLPYLEEFEFGPSINMAATELAGAALRPALARASATRLGSALHSILNFISCR